MGEVEHKPRHLPRGISGDLNLRAFIDVPPHAQSIQEEVQGLIKGAMRGRISPEEVSLRVLQIIGREQSEFEKAVKEAIYEYGRRLFR